MIGRIQIEDLGPHVDTDITITDPLGSTEVRGPSQVGKSVIIDAVTIALWGVDHTGRPYDLDQIRDGADEVAVAVTTARGTRISRRLRRKGRRQTRAIDGAKHTTEQAMREAIGPLGDLGDHQLPLRVLVPMGWRELAESAGGGRALRDAIASVGEDVDIADVVRELMAQEGHDHGPGDAVNEGAAVAQRKRAREAAIKLEGAVEQLEAAAAYGTVTQPLPEEPTEAQAVIDLDARWSTWHHAHADQTDQVRAQQRYDEWRQRFGALGPIPDVDSEVARERDRRARLAGQLKRGVAKLEDARSRLALLDVLVAQCEAAPDLPHELANAGPLATERLRVAQRALDDLRAAEGTCPTCAQPWDRTEAIGHAEAEVSACTARVAEAEQRADEWLQTATERQALQHESAVAERGDLAALIAGELEPEVEVRRSAVAACDAAIAALKAKPAAWRQAKAALGPCPRRPSSAKTAPPPSQPEPSEEAVQAARDAIADYTRQRGAAEHHATETERARRQLATARAELERAKAEHTRCEALVRVCRVAPTEAARRSLEALGDISPVSMRWTPSGGVDVLVDGRPWHLASQGRQIVADARLRAGLRRALGMEWLVLVVDQVQSIGGMPLPEIEGPVWWLRTTDGAGLEVTP